MFSFSLAWKSVCKCVFVGLLLSAISTTTLGDPTYRGVSLTPASEDVLFDASAYDESILDLKQIGANTVAVDLFWLQPNLTTAPEPALIEQTIDATRAAIEAIQNRGLDVVLRSNVTVLNGDSRRISPSDVWFENYGQILEAVAAFGAEQNVMAISIGSSLNELERNTEDWSNLISRVRDRFSGRLTYGADVRDDPEVGGGFRDVSFWDELDFVGLNAYVPLTFDFNAIPEDLANGAAQWADDIDAWRQTSGIDKPVVFTASGFRSKNGGAVFPFERAGDRVDLEEQALAYDAVLSTFEQRDWWDGGFWDGWTSDALAGGAADQGFTPQNKPAEEVLAARFGGRATYRLHPSLMESWEKGLNGWSLPNSGSTSGLSIDEEIGATDGQKSLSVLTGSGVTAAKLWTLEGSEAYTLLQTAFEEPDLYELRLDVSADATQSSPGANSSVRVALQDDFSGPIAVNSAVVFEAMNGEEGVLRDTIAIPLNEFGDLNPFAIFYEIHLDTSNTSNGPLFVDNLRLVSILPGDITNDALTTADDIDALSDAIRRGWMDSQYDVNADGVVDVADRDAWITAAGTLNGDFDLNGKVEFADFLLLSANFGQPGNWLDGDATGDRMVDFADFLLLSTNFGSSVEAAAVPEPRSGGFVLGCCVAFVLVRRGCSSSTQKCCGPALLP